MSSAYDHRPSAAPKTGLMGILAVHALIGELMNDAMTRPDELRKLDRWIEVYDANDEMRQGIVASYIKTAHRVVQTTLDDIKRVLLAQPHQPGALRELLRAYSRLSQIIRELRAGRLK